MEEVTWYKMPEGHWGVRINLGDIGVFPVGKVVTVVRKNGETSQQKLSKLWYLGNKVAIFEIDSTFEKNNPIIQSSHCRALPPERPSARRTNFDSLSQRERSRLCHCLCHEIGSNVEHRGKPCPCKTPGWRPAGYEPNKCNCNNYNSLTIEGHESHCAIRRIRR